MNPGEFLLDPGITHLNHGGFGACPAPVLGAWQRWQRELERHPSAMLSHGYRELVSGVRGRLGEFVGCPAGDVVPVSNATAGLNAVARSVPLAPGDEVLATDHEYGAMDVLWEHVCARAGARYVRAPLPLPAGDPGELADALWSAVTPATRVVFCSHITSKSAVVMPVAEICRRARAAGILSVVDGAHAVGQLPLGLAALGADFYAASCHKWLCAPRGTGFLHVRPEHQGWVAAPLFSHGSQPGGPFLDRFGWQGTRDPSLLLAIPAAVDFCRARLEPARGGCHQLARAARTALADLFGLEPFTPDSPEWFAQMVSAPVPRCDPEATRARLLEEYRVDVPVREWSGGFLVRVSLAAYNTADDLDRLVTALTTLFRRP